MAAYKLRVLTSFFFQTQQQDPVLSNLQFSNHAQTKWLESFPNETAFPDGLFFIPKWDLNQASAQLQALRVEARLEENVNPQIMRINTTVFCESVGQDLKLLENTSLSEKWQFPRFRGKGLPLPWIQQIIQLLNDSGKKCPSAPVTCISQIPLEKWNSMSSAEIRNALPPKPGPLKRFRAAIRNA